jgi:lysozyme family protein
VSKPWEKYAQNRSGSPSKARGPWERYSGSASPTEAFQKAIQRVLGHEGGYANDPDDKGGETNFGISTRANPDVDVKSLTKESATALYKERYWDAIDADSLPEDIRDVAFDAAVNHGPGWAKRVLRETGGDVDKFIAHRRKTYKAIAKADPSQEKFLGGWMNRLDSYVHKRPWDKYNGRIDNGVGMGDD